jgi:RimJ/RimL family protein N-acetyltransferase
VTVLTLPDPPLADAGVGIVLRPWSSGRAPGSPDDAPALAAAWADPGVAAHTVVPPDATEAAARRWIAGEAVRRRRGLALDLVIATASAGEASLPAAGSAPDRPGLPPDAGAGAAPGAPDAVLGEVGLAHLDPDGRAEVGFWLAPAARGRGVATAAVRLLTGFALRPVRPARPGGSPGLGLRQVWARTTPGDLRAAGVLGRAGYRRRGEAAGATVWASDAASLPA